jgi:hypothetical protein
VNRNSRLAARLTSVFLAIFVSLGVAAVTAPEAVAAPRYTIKYNCGRITCSVYLSRDLTRFLRQKLDPVKNNGPIALAAAAGIACGAAALPSGPGSIAAGGYCAAAATIYGQSFVNTLKTAESKNQCVRLRTLGPTTNIIGMYNDNNGKYCV